MLKKVQYSLLLLCISLVSSCSLLDYKAQSELLERLSYISGSIQADVNEDHQLYVVLLKQHDTHLEVLNQHLVDSNNNYHFGLLPGKYIVGAYIDENNSHTKDDNETLSFYTKSGKKAPEIVNIEAGVHLTLDNLMVKKSLAINDSIIVSLPKIRENIGKVVSLSNPMFAQENSTMGLWQPLTFLDTIGGGLLMLQEYNPKKIPVVFVHGISGNPREFISMIDSLDTDKYQPWVLYYPSGFQLDLVSGYLLNTLSQLEAEYGFSDIHLIAHSMGGLMSRSFLMKHQEKSSTFDVSLYMTINSPLYGMDSARSGVKSSPIVLASWRDVATGSDYVKRVHNWQVPSNIPYHLVFSYLPGEEGDGVVAMNSQLSLSLQEEAEKIYGFKAQHAGILKDENFMLVFNKILADNYTETKSKGIKSSAVKVH